MSDSDIIIDGVKYSTTRDAADACGISSNYVTRFCREGLVRATRVGGVWYVDADSLIRFINTQEAKKKEWHGRIAEERQRERMDHGKALPKLRVAPQILHRLTAERRAKETAARKTMLVGAIAALLLSSSLSLAFSGIIPGNSSGGNNIAGVADVGVAFVKKFTSFFDSLFATNETYTPPFLTRTVVQTATTTQSAAQPLAATQNPSVIQNITQPVIDRVREVYVGGSGITEAVLDARLQALSESLQFVSARQTDNIADELIDFGVGGSFEDATVADSDITNSRWVGGSISGAAISGGSISGSSLSLSGDAAVTNLTADNATSTNATSTNLYVSGALSATTLCLSSDCRGAWPTDSSFSTTSADYWKTQNNFFSTTSNDYWKSASDFFSTTSGSYFLAQNQGNAFSTTSASYFISQNGSLGFSTTSNDYWQSQRNFFSTTSADYYKSVNNFFSTTSADYYVHSSTTIPKTYTSNTFTNSNVFSGALTANGAFTLGSLNGPLQANGGIVSATTSIGVLYGGTGLTNAPTYGQLLLGQANGSYALTATSSLGLQSVLQGTQGQIAYFSGTNTAMGTSSLFIASSGNVGIGTTSPQSLLEIYKASDTAASSLKITGGSSAFSAAESRLQLTEFAVGGFDYGFSLAYQHSPALFVIDSLVAGATTTRLAIDRTSGNVGIGTTSPSATLSVAGNQYLTGTLGIGTNNLGTHQLRIAGGGQSGIQGMGGMYANPNNPNVEITAAGSTGVEGGFFSYGTGSRFYMGSWSNHPLTIRTGNSDRLSIDTSGNVGIGTSSPGNLLSLQKDTGNGPYMTLTNASRIWGFGNDGSSLLIKTTGTGNPSTLESNTAQMVINTSGNVGIGATSPVSQLTVSKTSNGAEGGALAIQNVGTGVSTAVALYLAPNNGGGNDLQRAASIKSRQTTSGNYADLGFFTSDAAAPTERLTITSAGNVGIGTTSPATKLNINGDAIYNTGAGGQLYINGATDPTLQLRIGYDTTNNFGFIRAIDVGDAEKNLILQPSGGNVGIGTTNPDNGKVEVKGGTVCVDTNSDDNASSCIASESDERLKTNIQTLSASSSLEIINALNPVSFDWRASDPTVLAHWPSLSRYAGHEHTIGLIAQEVMPVLPEALSLETVGDSEVQYFQLDYTKFIPHLIGALKELAARIETLSGTVTALAERIVSKEIIAVNGNFETLSTSKLCVGSVCVTESEFLRMVESSGQTAAAPAPTTPAPEETAASSTAATSTPATEPAAAETQEPQESQDMASTTPATSSAASETTAAEAPADTASSSPES